MSIQGGIDRLIAEGRLFRLPSLVTGDETARTMYVSAEILDSVTPPFAENRDGERLAEFRQTLDAFSEGGEFSVAEDPYSKPSDAMLARVDPVEANIWDIRSIAPSPGIRCLGGFASQDTFVALTWEYRENFDDGADKWTAEITRCRSIWRDLFGTCEPFKGALDECLTNYYTV
jgi:hypothetical protein